MKMTADEYDAIVEIAVGVTMEQNEQNYDKILALVDRVNTTLHGFDNNTVMGAFAVIMRQIADAVDKVPDASMTSEEFLPIQMSVLYRIAASLEKVPPRSERH